MKIKVGFRQPVLSKIDSHKWFISKDQYGIYYFILVNIEIFEEKYVFKLFKKAQNLVDSYSDILVGENTLQEKLATELTKLVDNYNKTISSNVGREGIFSPDDNLESIKSESNPSVSIPSKLSDAPSKDPNVIFNIIEERNKRLAKL